MTKIIRKGTILEVPYEPGETVFAYDYNGKIENYLIYDVEVRLSNLQHIYHCGGGVKLERVYSSKEDAQRAYLNKIGYTL